MAAVNQLGEKLSSFIEDKESVRAEGSVDKYIIVLTLPLARVLTNKLLQLREKTWRRMQPTGNALERA